MECYISLIAVFFCLRIWNALTDNYGNVMPVDWKSSHTRALHLLTLNLSEKGVSEELGPSDCAAGADGRTEGAASLSTSLWSCLLVSSCCPAYSCRLGSTTVPLLVRSCHSLCVHFCMAAKFCQQRSLFPSAYTTKL